MAELHNDSRGLAQLLSVVFMLVFLFRLFAVCNAEYFSIFYIILFFCKLYNFLSVFCGEKSLGQNLQKIPLIFFSKGNSKEFFKNFCTDSANALGFPFQIANDFLLI